MTAQDQGRQLYAGAGFSNAGALLFDYPATADGNGVWFHTNQGFYLYTAGSGLQKVFEGEPRDIHAGGACA